MDGQGVGMWDDLEAEIDKAMKKEFANKERGERLEDTEEEYQRHMKALEDWRMAKKEGLIGEEIAEKEREKNRTKKELKKKITSRWQRWRIGIEEEIRQARVNNDYKLEWNLLRRLGGRGKGPNKRSARVGEIYKPTREEWVEHMGKEGGKGGCRAREVGDEDTVEGGR